MDATTVVAVVGILGTLAGSLGGTWLSGRRQRSERIALIRRDSYVTLLTKVQSMITSYSMAVHTGEEEGWTDALQDLTMEAHLLGGADVRNAIAKLCTAEGEVDLWEAFNELREAMRAEILD